VAGVPDAADPRRRIARAADQARDSAAALVHADGENLDAIAVHQSGGVGARQRQRRGPVIGHDQHFAAGPAAHAAGHALALARRGKTVRPLDGLAVAHHRRQTLGQCLALRSRVQSQTLGKARGAQRLGRLRQMLEQQLTTRDGIGIPRFLEF
jgi:hypothetical protein